MRGFGSRPGVAEKVEPAIGNVEGSEGVNGGGVNLGRRGFTASILGALLCPAVVPPATAVANERDSRGLRGDPNGLEAPVFQSAVASTVELLRRLGTDPKLIQDFVAKVQKLNALFDKVGSPDERAQNIGEVLGGTKKDSVEKLFKSSDQRVTIATAHLVIELAKGDKEVALGVLDRAKFSNGTLAGYWLFAALTDPLGDAFGESAEAGVGKPNPWNEFISTVNDRAASSPERYKALQAAATFAGQYAKFTGEVAAPNAALSNIVGLKVFVKGSKSDPDSLNLVKAVGSALTAHCLREPEGFEVLLRAWHRVGEIVKTRSDQRPNSRLNDIKNQQGFFPVKAHEASNGLWTLNHKEAMERWKSLSIEERRLVLNADAGLKKGGGKQGLVPVGVSNLAPPQSPSGSYIGYQGVSGYPYDNYRGPAAEPPKKTIFVIDGSMLDNPDQTVDDGFNAKTRARKLVAEELMKLPPGSRAAIILAHNWYNTDQPPIVYGGGFFDATPVNIRNAQAWVMGFGVSKNALDADVIPAMEKAFELATSDTGPASIVLLNNAQFSPLSDADQKSRLDPPGALDIAATEFRGLVTTETWLAIAKKRGVAVTSHVMTNALNSTPGHMQNLAAKTGGRFFVHHSMK